MLISCRVPTIYARSASEIWIHRSIRGERLGTLVSRGGLLGYRTTLNGFGIDSDEKLAVLIAAKYALLDIQPNQRNAPISARVITSTRTSRSRAAVERDICDGSQPPGNFDASMNGEERLSTLPAGVCG